MRECNVCDATKSSSYCSNCCLECCSPEVCSHGRATHEVDEDLLHGPGQQGVQWRERTTQPEHWEQAQQGIQQPYVHVWIAHCMPVDT